MRVRRFVVPLMLAAAVLMAACRSGPPSGPVVIYLVDTLRPDRMSVYGARRPTSPAAERLARESVVYDNAFCVSTWTRPSVATLLTSVLPSASATLNRWGRLDDSAWYLPEALQRQGWGTAAFVANGNLFDDRMGFKRGFDSFRTIVRAVPAGELTPGTEWHATAREVVDPVLEFVEAQKSPRFFLYVHVVDPHIPYVLRPEYAGLFADATEPGSLVPLDYDRSVRQADDEFGRLAEALRKKGFWEEATVIYTSDHGEELGEHGRSGHGHSVFDEQLRVPLLVRYPRGESGGTRRPDPVSLADVVPTIADRYALAPVPGWIGTSLWRNRLPADRELYFTEDLDQDRLYGLRRGPAKVIVRLYPTFERTVFFLDRDPGEQGGTGLPCGADRGAAPEMLASLRGWRERDAAAYPSLRFGAGRDRGHCEASIDLSTVREPFLTWEDVCRWGSEVRGSQLVYRSDPGAPPERLLVSADDRGRHPEVEFLRGRTRCPVDTVKARYIEGPVSEQHLERLRALGYLQGP
ncbi:MAG TPA: sulfatase [Vicinamibacteria bacterium]